MENALKFIIYFFFNLIYFIFHTPFFNTNFFLQFQRSSEHSLFSNSVVDVFTQLSQCFDVVSKLECPDPEIWKRYMRRFAKTVVKVLLSYVEIVKADFTEQMKDERIVRLIINFINTFS